MVIIKNNNPSTILDYVNREKHYAEMNRVETDHAEKDHTER